MAVKCRVADTSENQEAAILSAMPRLTTNYYNYTWNKSFAAPGSTTQEINITLTETQKAYSLKLNTGSTIKTIGSDYRYQDMIILTAADVDSSYPDKSYKWMIQENGVSKTMAVGTSFKLFITDTDTVVTVQESSESLNHTSTITNSGYELGVLRKALPSSLRTSMFRIS